MSIETPFWHPSEASSFLLDWDGVIAETKLDFSAVRERYYGGRKALLLEEADTLSPEDKESLMKDLRSLEIEGALNAAPVPGALELLEKLNSKNISYAVVSRNCSESIVAAAEKIGVTLPPHVWSRDNSKYIKPDPRALIDAAHALGTPVSKCVLVGDFIYDIQCARRAGMRAVLVQRENSEWDSWSDVSYPLLTDLLRVMDSPEPLAPWEYREIYAKRGAKWLEAASKLVFSVPDSTSPTLDCWLLRTAALGIGAIAIPDDIIFTASDWKNSPSFPTSAMGLPLCDVVKEFFASRYPMIKVIGDTENAVKAPKNSLDLMRFTERKIF